MLKTQNVKLSELTFTDYNPKHRTNDVNRLMKSMEMVGLIYPIVVNKADMVIIDGHRRVTAARKLGWEEIPALLSEGQDRDQIYAEVNATARSISGADALYVWYRNPNAVTAYRASKFASMEEMLGRKLVGEMVRLSLSPRMFARAKALATYCGWDDKGHVQMTMKWVMTFGFGPHLDAGLTNGQIRRDMLAACISKTRPLKLTFVSTE